MARANAIVSAAGDGSWTLAFRDGGGGGAAAATALRSKPPVPEDAVAVEELPLPPDSGAGGVDAQGHLVPYFPRSSLAAEVEAAEAAAEAAAQAAAAAAAAAARTKRKQQQQPEGAAAPATGEPTGPSSSGGGEEEEERAGSEGEQEAGGAFDPLCCACDDGGDLLACDGPCMRSFHVQAAGEDGEEGGEQPCNPLRLPAELAAALQQTSDTFRCPNCLAGRQQCYACKREGEEGSEVFKCIHATCGRHYHPACAGAEPGKPFACKLHVCGKCGGGPMPGDRQRELVPCRRCPLAYHLPCLPASLSSDPSLPGRRVWLANSVPDTSAPGGVRWLDGLQASLLYCGKHRLDGDTGQAFFEREEAAASGEAVQQPYCLVDAGLLQAAHLHYARQFPHLPWSRRLLAEHRQQQEQQQQPAKKKQKLGGGEAAAAEEDGAAAAEAGAVGGRVQRLLREAEDDPSLALPSLLAVTRRPQPYRRPQKKSIDDATLAALERTVAHAAERQLSGPKLAGVVDAAAVRMLRRRHDDLAAALAPLEPGDRRSARRRASQPLLAAIAERLANFLRPGDQVADLCCGPDNAFVPLVKAACLRRGVWPVSGRSFDAVLAAHASDLVQRSWLDLGPPGEQHGLAPGPSLCTCLAPPPGSSIRTANQFVERAAALQPRVIAVLVSPRTVIPAGYAAAAEMSADALCGPGSPEEPLSSPEEAPVLRILVRSDQRPEAARSGDPQAFATPLNCTEALRQQQQAP